MADVLRRLRAVVAGSCEPTMTSVGAATLDRMRAVIHVADGLARRRCSQRRGRDEHRAHGRIDLRRRSRKSLGEPALHVRADHGRQAFLAHER